MRSGRRRRVSLSAMVIFSREVRMRRGQSGPCLCDKAGCNHL